MSDIEHLRLIESIVEASPAIIFRWIIQEGWPVEYVSKNVEQLGYSQKEMMSGEVSWPEITHPDDVPRLEQEVREILAVGEDTWSQVYRIRTRSGEYRWMRDWNLVLRDKKGIPQKIQGIVMDITPEKAAEHQRETAREELEIALAQVISGFLPICSSCKAIRESDGGWTPIEEYIFHKSQVQFSHGYCPECARKIFGDIYRRS
jgi:PAS domain S-box-containing protein